MSSIAVMAEGIFKVLAKHTAGALVRAKRRKFGYEFETPFDIAVQPVLERRFGGWVPLERSSCEPSSDIPIEEWVARQGGADVEDEGGGKTYQFVFNSRACRVSFKLQRVEIDFRDRSNWEGEIFADVLRGGGGLPQAHLAAHLHSGGGDRPVIPDLVFSTDGDEINSSPIKGNPVLVSGDAGELTVLIRITTDPGLFMWRPTFFMTLNGVNYRVSVDRMGRVNGKNWFGTYTFEEGVNAYSRIEEFSPVHLSRWAIGGWRLESDSPADPEIYPRCARLNLSKT